MKSLYRIFTTAVVITLLLINSCISEDEIVVDLAPILTNGSWTFSSLDTGDDLTNGFYEGIYGGNVINFSMDGSCSDKLVGVNGIGTWSLNGNQTILSLSITYDDGDTRNESWNIINISNTELTYTFDISPNTLEMRYTH